MNTIDKRLDKLCNELFTQKEYSEVLPWPKEENYTTWAKTRCFKARRTESPYAFDYFAIGYDGKWWRGGANIPGAMGWDIEKLAAQAGV